MPPRFAYWTIVADGRPTAFRAASAEELLPTLRQLQRHHPAEIRWFARGRLWDSPLAAARDLRDARRAKVKPRPRPPAAGRPPRGRSTTPRRPPKRR
jgi:hypothetical protein